MRVSWSTVYPNSASILNLTKRQLTSAAFLVDESPDNKVHGANMGPTWVLSAQGGPHVDPMNFAIWVISEGFQKRVPGLFGDRNHPLNK